MSDVLTNLEQQLAALKATTGIGVPSIPTPTPAPTSVTLSLDDLRKLVKEMVGESTSILPVEATQVKEYTMLEAVNLALTGEEQSWLCKDEVIKGVANFMATDKGRKFTKQFITDYREYYES